jgi:hypothetical protein
MLSPLHEIAASEGGGIRLRSLTPDQGFALDPPKADGLWKPGLIQLSCGSP